MSSNTSVVPFLFEAHEIRVTDQDGNPWFVLRDLLDAIASKTHISDAVESINQGLGDGYVDNVPILDSLGRNQNTTIIAESAATYLLSRSNTEKGRELNRFIHVDVLPSIRKTGSYSLPVAPPEPPFVALPIENGMRVFTTADVFARNVLKLIGNQALLSANQATYKALGVDVLDHFGQKALPADQRGKTYTQTELGRSFFNLPINARQMGILLNLAGLQNRIDDHWEPTEKAAGLFEWLDTGKWHHSGTPVKQLKWFKQVIEHPDFVTVLTPRAGINTRIN